jgi:3-oxoadipate enol-lactonase
MKELPDNALLDAQIAGRGPNLVLLHSLLAGRSSFAGVMATLSKHFRVILAALPGFGKSPPVYGGLPAVADRVAAAIRIFADGQPVRLLGNGYGGFIALQAVIRHPGLAERLVLADAGATFSPNGQEAFRAMARGAAAKGLEAIADIAMRRLFAPDFHAANPEIVKARRDLFIASDPAVIIAACEALASLDLRSALAGVRIPVLAVVGEQDEATPAAMSRELVAALPNATLTILPGLAHVPQLQAPDRFLDAVLPFLS